MTQSYGISTSLLGNIAIFTLDRPPVNAMDSGAYRKGRDVLERLDADENVRAIVVTGAGTLAFCAGTDRHELASPTTVDSVTETALAFFETLARCSKPLVGALNGPAVGGGAMIAADCDLLIGVRSASLRIPELTLGFPGAASHIKRLVPYFLGQQMMLLGREVSAADALATGVYVTVVDSGADLLPSAMECAQRVAALDVEAVVSARRIFREPESSAALGGYRQELSELRRLLGLREMRRGCCQARGAGDTGDSGFNAELDTGDLA